MPEGGYWNGHYVIQAHDRVLVESVVWSDGKLSG